MSREGDPRVAVRAAREVAHAASYLASEAAALARAFEDHGALDASIAASEASIRAANRAFELDEKGRAIGHEAPHVRDAIQTAAHALEAAHDALASARRALEAAAAASTSA